MKYIVLIPVCLFMAFFVGVLSVVTTAMDVRLVYGIVMQTRAATWPTTRGIVDGSDVVEDHSSEGTSYTAAIRYQYRVDGRYYESNRIHYGFDFHGKRGAKRTLKPFPRGSDVSVYYNPRDPSQAVLETRIIEGGDLFAAMFLTPVNLLMIFCWLGLYNTIRKGRDEKPPAGDAVRVIEEERGVRVRFTRVAPRGVAALWASVAAMAVMFAILMLFGGGDLLLPAVAGWAIILYAARRGYLRMKTRIDGGWYDLMIDEVGLTVTLPQMVPAYKGARLSHDQLQRVEVHSTRGKDGQSNRVRLRWSDGGDRSVVLLDARAPESAEALASWLRKRLVLETPASDATAASQPSTADSSRG